MTSFDVNTAQAMSWLCLPLNSMLTITVLQLLGPILQSSKIHRKTNFFALVSVDSVVIGNQSHEIVPWPIAETFVGWFHHDPMPLDNRRYINYLFSEPVIATHYTWLLMN